MTLALPLAQTLLQCLEDALVANGNPPGIICLRHGDHVSPMLSTTTDECCTGLAWVRVVSTNRADRFDTGSSSCINHLRMTTLEMGVVRCMPTPPADQIVTCDQWTAVAVQADSDHSAMEAALCCLVADGLLPGDPEYRASLYEPRGPDGNCVGGTMQIEIDHGCACGSQG